MEELRGGKRMCDGGAGAYPPSLLPGRVGLVHQLVLFSPVRSQKSRVFRKSNF